MHGWPAGAGACTPLKKHPSSKSILQDAFVRFHHLLFQHTPPLLPLHEWGARGSRDFTAFTSLARWCTPASFERI